MQSFKKYSPLLCIPLLAQMLAACSTPASNVQAQYISPYQYNTYSCENIRVELTRVSARVQELTVAQNQEAMKDTFALGVGLVLFWPALFFMIGDDKKEELSRLKGEYEALERTAIEKNCPVAAELQEARQQA